MRGSVRTVTALLLIVVTRLFAGLAGGIDAAIAALFSQSPLVLLRIARSSTVRVSGLFRVLAFLMRASALFTFRAALLLFAVSGGHGSSLHMV